MSMIKCSGAGPCQTASTPGCGCACGGVNHGARGRLVWAAALTVRVEDRTLHEAKHVEDALARQSAAAAAVEESLRPKKRRIRTGTAFRNEDSNRAGEYTRSVDIINWLVAHPDDRQSLEDLVGLLNGTLESIDHEYGAPNRELLLRTADHLWCDVIAALVVALEELTNLQDNLTDALTDAAAETITSSVLSLINASRSRPHEQRPRGKIRDLTSRAERDVRENVTRQLVEPAISEFVGAALKAVGWTASPLPLTLLKLRLLAVLLCPDPSEHKVVWDHCLTPLFASSMASAPLTALLTERTALVGEMTWGERRPTPKRRPRSRH